ncbi:hypothetical protein Q0Z83_046820 [Actinoplanes sichuanensis]|uniref:Uncharacterized protein n=1 Tax=Actinoplanes sichuanensis TaxID=512349 RepID=A0ABW4A9P8_9ACTN|nr:hypothetical protein [Actinoplanes sichuanensis]BEL06491.1 hypothetical protein Q0Z83_046820 [Actinoplanes sichuanensis]
MSNINYGIQAGGSARIQATNLAVGTEAQVHAGGAADDVATKLDEVLRLIEQHRAALPEPDLARAEVEMARTELTARRPEPDRILAALRRAGEHVTAVGAITAAVQAAVASVGGLL